LCSGSEAVEFAVQSCRSLVDRPLLLTFAGSYLSAFGSAGSIDDEEWFEFDWTPCLECTWERGCDLECRLLREIPTHRIGGLVLEPGSTHGEVRFPPVKPVAELVRRVRGVGGLILVNEVTTGLGRTGRWGGFEHYDVQPDIVALGKTLGNGYPVSAVAMAAATATRFEESGISYVQSHQNDPLGCAVAAEVIDVIREDRLVERSERAGGFFLELLEGVAKRHDLVRGVRGRGLMLAVELGGDDPTALMYTVHWRLLQQGFIVGINPGAALLRFYPPLTIDEGLIEQMVDRLDSALSTTAP
jgi:acetylornithine aminotransferase